MAYLLGIALLLVGLIISIGLHEIGHMVPAKKFGVKVPQYFVGLGPTIWSMRRGETEYGIKALPLGGYVRLAGMFPPKRALAHAPAGKPGALAEEAREISDVDLAPGEEHRAFYALSMPKKLVVMLGGPVMNLVIAFVLLAIIMMGWGLPAATPTVSTVAECATDTDPCDAPGAAWAAGIRPGDTITSYAGTKIATWEDLTQAIAANGSTPTDVTFVSDGQTQTARIAPVVASAPDASGTQVERPLIGVTAGYERVPAALTDVVATTGEAVGQTFGVIVQLPVRLYDTARNLFTDEPREDGVMSIIGVGRMAGEISSAPSSVDEGSGAASGPTLGDKAMTLLSLLASLNIALFAFNLIPLLPLDGGHIAGALWEGTRRQVARARGRRDPGPVDTARLLPLTYTVFILLIGMTLLLGYADIVKPISF